MKRLALFFTAICALAMIHTVSASGLSSPVTNQKIGIPSYFWPDSNTCSVSDPLCYWTRAIAKAPTVSFMIINPDSGPGSAFIPEYATQIAKAHQNGVNVMAYVYTSYGDRPQATVIADVDKYYQWYNIDGIFFDEVENENCTDVTYYTNLKNNVKGRSTGAKLVILNPGTDIDPCFSNTGDIFAIFESGYASYVNWTPQYSWEQTDSSGKFWHIIHTANQAELKQAVKLSKNRNAGYLWVTSEIFVNPNTDNPYDTIPPEPYWSIETDLVKRATIEDGIGVYKNGFFYLRNTNTSGNADNTILYGGAASHLPVVGDWNGDAIDTIGIYDTSTGVFQLRDSNSGGAPNYVFTFGNAGDTPLAGRWDSTMLHDGVGVYRNSNGILYLRRNLDTGFSDYFMIFGNPGDKGIAGDWNADGYDSVGVYRNSNVRFYLSNVNGNGITFSDISFNYSVTDSVPFASDWKGNGQSLVGFAVQSIPWIYYRDSLAEYSPSTGITYGPLNRVPIAGLWELNLPTVPPNIIVYPQVSAPNQSDNTGAD